MSEHEQLRGALDALAAQLDEMREVDPEVAAQLSTTVEQAQAVLQGRPSRAEEHGTLIEHLKAAVLEYEASHPTLAGNIGSLIDALGRMGI